MWWFHTHTSGMPINNFYDSILTMLLCSDATCLFIALLSLNGFEQNSHSNFRPVCTRLCRLRPDAWWKACKNSNRFSVVEQNCFRKKKKWNNLGTLLAFVQIDDGIFWMFPIYVLLQHVPLHESLITKCALVRFFAYKTVYDCERTTKLVANWHLPVWIMEWRLRISFCTNDLPHSSHRNGFSPATNNWK